MMMTPCRLVLSGCPWSWNPQLRATVKAPVRRAVPGARPPTSLIAGQSVWAGCGLEAISCALVSLFTNATRWPTLISTCLGETTPATMVNVAAPPGGGVAVGTGDLGELGDDEPLPHAPMVTTPATTRASASSPRPVRIAR